MRDLLHNEYLLVTGVVNGSATYFLCSKVNRIGKP